MSYAPKGYPTSQKLDRLIAEHACVSPVGVNKNGLAVAASLFSYQTANGTAEAGSTINTVVANGIHGFARYGDIVRFTSGDLIGIEVPVVSVSTNTLTLGDDLSAAPQNGDGFEVLRFISPSVNSAGALAMAMSFIRDGVATNVVEDTNDSSNNTPLPVKIESTSGEVNITAGDLNVQMEHDGPSPASVRIGDGTTLVGVTTDNQMRVSFLDTGTDYSSVRIGDGSNLAEVSGDNELKVRVNSTTGLTKAIAPTYNDYGTTPVTTAAYVQLVASTGDQIRKVQIFDSSGETLVIATGAGGAEVDQFYVFPGGIETLVDIPAGTRISIKAVTGNATAGYFAMNAWK